jgi:hypothetical protein
MMHAINQGHRRWPFARNHPRRSITGSQQGLPLRLDRPAQVPFRMALTQRGDGRQCMQNIAHGAEPDNENT